MMTRLVVLQVIAGIIGGLIAAKKGRGVLIWFLLCFIFPFLTIVILILPPLTGPAVRRCPQCFRPLGRDESVCGHCGKDKPIELVQCGRCGSYVSENKDCPVCARPK